MRTTGFLGWLGAISLGLVFGGLSTAVTGPVLGVVATVLIIWGGVRAFATPVHHADTASHP